MAEETSANEPVKVKMTLRRAQPSIQGAAEVRPAAAASVEAVEARWRAEDAKMRRARARGAAKSFLSWCFILLVVLGAGWFFFGESHLPARYAYPSVRRNVLALWDRWFGEPQPEPLVEPKKDPVDVATAAQRLSLRAAADLLEKVCTTEPPLQDDYDLYKAVANTDRPTLFRDVVNADMLFKKAVKSLADMEKHNEKMQRPGNVIGGRSGSRGRVEMKTDKELAVQKERVARNMEACALARIRTVERLLETIRKREAQWTGPESRKDAEWLQDRLARQLHKYKLMETPWRTTRR